MPFSRTGELDLSFNITTTSLTGNLLKDAIISWPYDTGKMPHIHVSLNIQGAVDWPGHIGYVLQLYNITTGTAMDGYFTTRQIQVSEPRTFGTDERHSILLTDIFNTTGISKHDAVEVVCLVQTNSGSGFFTSGHYVLEAKPVLNL